MAGAAPAPSVPGGGPERAQQDALVPSGGQERLPAGHRPFRRVRDHPGLTAALCLAIALLVLTSGLTGLVKGTTPEAPVLTLSGVQPQTVTIGEPATVTANVTGGVPDSGVGDLYQGYLVYFFYGQTSSNGSIGYQKEVVNAPTGCLSVDQVCTAPAELSFSHVYSSPGSYDTSFTVYDAAGDYAIGTDVVTVLPPTVTVTPSANVSSVIVDASVRFSATVTTSPASYESDSFAFQWEFGDNASAWGNPVVHAFNFSGNYVVTVRAFDNRTGTAGQGSLTNLLVTDPAPKPVISVGTPSVLPRLYAFPEDTLVNFSGALTTDVPSDVPSLRYLWSFGDGAVAVGLETAHEFTTNGTYTVTLTATDRENVQGSTSVRVIVVDQAPVANATTPPPPAPIGDLVTFTAGSTVAVPTSLPFENYTWSSSDPAATDMPTAYGIVGRAAYLVPGTYRETVTVRNTGGLSSSAGTAVVVTDAPPNVGVDSAYTLANLTFGLTASGGTTVNASVVEDGRWVAGRTVAFEVRGSTTSYVTLPRVEFPLADSDVISVSESSTLSVAGGPVGAATVSLSIAFWGGGAGCAPSPGSVCGPSSYVGTLSPWTPWTVSANAASVGQTVFLNAQLFSPGPTSLSTVWGFGDGGSATTYTTAPTEVEPTLANVLLTHRWPAGGSYVLTLRTTDAYGKSDLTSVVVGEQGSAEISGLAPTVALELPSPVPVSPSVPLAASVSSQDYGTGTFGLSWSFGDGQHATESVVGSSASEVHLFPYSSTQYLVVVRASVGYHGSSTVAWGFLTIPPAPPVASFSAPNGSVLVSEAVLFNAGSSRPSSGAPPGGLVYGWTFGDGTTPDSLRAEGPVVEHEFDRVGTFPVTLTVTNVEGVTASTTEDVVVNDLPVSGLISDRTVTVDQLAAFNVTPFLGGPTDLASMSAVWNWGDGSPHTTGLSAGHTYQAPGTYDQSVELTTPGGATDVLSAAVTVLDEPLTVLLPYNGFVVYGENHTATFDAIVLGSGADERAGPTAFQYAWSFGDGSSPTTTRGSSVGSVGHVYTMSGNPTLNVSVVGPYGTTGSASAMLTTVPNWDGDGIPDEYASLVLHLQPGSTPSHGTGFTPFLQLVAEGGLTPSALAEDGGLTPFQQVFGTVTGFVSDPLDPNPAGDGIPTTERETSDSFDTTSVVNFTSGGTDYLEGVDHPASGAPVVRVTLYDEIVSADLSGLDVQLADDGPGFSGGASVDLGTPSSPVSNYTLLTDSPLGGPVSNYSLGLSQFETPSNWALEVSGGAGTIESATIVITYYLDPNSADPFGSGLTIGNGFSLPVFNATEPSNASYTTFNGETFTYQTVYYFPYTEQYWKLSVVQGLPYYPWNNASYRDGRNASVSISDPYAFATYYGDREFGIVPWQAHDVDPVLTDGMKAYGRADYDLTADHYLSVADTYARSQRQRYAWDYLSYGGPLNPTANSTGTNGANDSSAVYPTGGPEVIAFYLNQAESNSISIFDFGADSNQGGVVQIQDTAWPGGPSMYTPSASGSNNYEFGDTSINWFFTYNVYYQLPLDPGFSDFTLNLWLYLNYDLSSGSEASASLTFANEPGVAQSFNAGGFNGYAIVYQLSRMPVVLVNSSREVQNLPGYGLRWEGSQQFYAIYLNMTGSTAGTPFEPGENLVLVSRSAFVNSSLNHTLVTGDVASMPFLASASMTTAGSNSEVDLVSTLNVSLGSPSYALSLLDSLVPHNASGAAIGGYEALNQTDFELLGLSPQVLHAAPYFPIAGYNSPVGTPAQNFWQKLGSIIYSVLQAIVSVVLAVVNFVVNLAEEIGQLIVAAWNAAVSAIESAIQAIINAFDFILAWIHAEFDKLFHEIANAVRQGIGEAIEAIAQPFMSLLVDQGIITESMYYTVFDSLNSTFNVSVPSPESNSTAGSQIATFIEILTGVFSAIFAIVAVVMYVIDIVSFGAAAPATEGASLTVQGVIATVVASVFGVIGGLATIFSLLTLIVPSFNGTDAFSSFFSFLGTNVTGQLGVNILNIVSNFLVITTDLIRTLIVSSLSGAYVVGLVVGVVALIAAAIATVLGDLYPDLVLAQLCLSAIGFILAAIGVVVQLLPTSEVENDAAQTTLADSALLVLSISAAGLALTNLIQSGKNCAANTTACTA